MDCPGSSTSNPHQSNTHQPVRKNAQWTTHENRIFVAACETVISDGHRNGKCFTKHGWNMLVHLFSKSSEHDWNRQQLKNYWNALQQKYKHFRELFNCTDVEYHEVRGLFVTSDEWWVHKIEEHKDYKDFKDKDCRVIFNYKMLFEDAFDNEKYVTIPSKMCKIRLAMFEDSGYNDLCDTIPSADENNESSDEAPRNDKAASSMDVSGRRSGEKRKSSGHKNKDKRKKRSARSGSHSVHQATTSSENLSVKIDRLVGPDVPDARTCIQELLATGRLQKNTDFYFWTCNFISLKRNREILEMQDSAKEKMDWLVWNWNEYRKGKSQ